MINKHTIRLIVCGYRSLLLNVPSEITLMCCRFWPPLTQRVLLITGISIRYLTTIFCENEVVCGAIQLSVIFLLWTIGIIFWYIYDLALVIIQDTEYLPLSVPRRRYNYDYIYWTYCNVFLFFCHILCFNVIVTSYMWYTILLNLIYLVGEVEWYTWA